MVSRRTPSAICRKNEGLIGRNCAQVPVRDLCNPCRLFARVLDPLTVKSLNINDYFPKSIGFSLNWQLVCRRSGARLAAPLHWKKRAKEKGYHGLQGSKERILEQEVIRRSLPVHISASGRNRLSFLFPLLSVPACSLLLPTLHTQVAGLFSR